MCDMDCLNCKHSDCINEEPATHSERSFSNDIDRDCNALRYASIDMTRYVRNRPDKTAYERARNREYEKKRKGSAARKESKRRQYLRHRAEKIAYQKQYYLEHKEEVLAGRKAYYEANRDEINRRRREAYREGRLCLST